MPQLTNTTPPVSDRVKLPFSFDSQKIFAEIESLKLNDFVFYNAIQLRAPAHMVDTSLPPPPPAEDYADGSWTDWLDTPALKASPYLQSILDTFKEHTTVNLVRLLRLAPGGVVKEHTDPTLGLQIEKSMIRLTIPITTNKEVQFFLNDSLVEMKAGECWYLRLSDPHKVINPSSSERINLTIDVIPNEWIRSLVRDASIS